MCAPTALQRRPLKPIQKHHAQPEQPKILTEVSSATMCIQRAANSPPLVAPSQPKTQSSVRWHADDMDAGEALTHSGARVAIDTSPRTD